MGMLEIPGTLRAGSIMMDADATGGGDSIGNSLSQKFSFVDSVPATDGLTEGNPYTYTITGTGNSFYYAKMTLSGKDSGGTHRTAEIEVFNGGLQSLFLSNIGAHDIEVAVYGDTVKVTPFFREVWYFTNHVEGYSGTLMGGNRIWGNRGLSAGGVDPSPAHVNTINYINIPTRGNAIDFGDLTAITTKPGAGTDGARAVFVGGGTPAPAPGETTMGYVAIGTVGNAAEFGSLHTASTEGGSASGGGRSVQAAGGSPSPDGLQHYAIGTFGNSVDFGELTAASGNGQGTSDGSRGLITLASTNVNYFNILTAGIATDFAEQPTAQIQAGAASDGTKAFWLGGEVGSAVDTISFMTIYTLTTGIDWGGELSGARRYLGGTMDGSRAVISNGYSTTDTIEFISMNAIGTSMTDFGNSTVTVYNNIMTSGG